MDLIDNGRFADALPLVSDRALAKTALADYAAYYTAVAELQLGRVDAARSRLEALRSRVTGGALSNLAVVRAAEAAVAGRDHPAAVALYQEALARKADQTEALLTSLASAADAAGLRQQALDAYARLYAEFPSGDAARTAGDELATAPDWEPMAPGSRRQKLERDRADRLFAAGRFEQARESYQALAPLAARTDNGAIALRLAECDFRLRRFHAARESLTSLADDPARRAEASYFLAGTIRELGDTVGYLAAVRRLVEQEPNSSWTEEALNDLGTYHILADEDEAAAADFRQLFERFPQGRNAPRAAWKAGWWAYRQGRFDETIALFEAAAAQHPSSDFRPSWLYWAARARQRAGQGDGTNAAFQAVVDDYRFTFYGEQSLKALGRAAVRPKQAPAAGGGGSLVPPPEGLALIRTLIGLELYDLAERELEAARREAGDSPALLATLAYVVGEQGDARRAIILMKRAYPSHLKAIDTLPREIQQVIHPLDHWALIRKYAASRKLDPFLVAGLINQESTFVADIKSHANAIGLMQVVPATGRRYARQFRIRRFSAFSLTRPEINLRIGTAYFSDLVKRFGNDWLALAAYNAGESRVQAWMPERRGLDADEFIDDIPFPETQGYVRKVLGLAGEYRRLYGPDVRKAPAATSTAARAPVKNVPAPKRR